MRVYGKMKEMERAVLARSSPLPIGSLCAPRVGVLQLAPENQVVVNGLGHSPEPSGSGRSPQADQSFGLSLPPSALKPRAPHPLFKARRVPSEGKF